MTPISRRTLLSGAIAAIATGASMVANAHNNAGVVAPPEPPPALPLTLDDGRRSSLDAQLAGRITAVQLMFTTCQATCPIQGAIFAQAAKELGNQVADAQWLSLSIDPSRDDPAALRKWLARYGALARWHAAQPDAAALDAVVEFLKARNSGVDRHTAQAYFFNRRGELVMRSVDFPPVAELVRVMQALAAKR